MRDFQRFADDRVILYIIVDFMDFIVRLPVSFWYS